MNPDYEDIQLEDQMSCDIYADNDNGRGWPGDGSGTDDFQDYNQNEANDYCNE